VIENEQNVQHNIQDWGTQFYRSRRAYAVTFRGGADTRAEANGAIFNRVSSRCICRGGSFSGQYCRFVDRRLDVCFAGMDVAVLDVERFVCRVSAVIQCICRILLPRLQEA
jgi:hypothetical protein